MLGNGKEGLQKSVDEVRDLLSHSHDENASLRNKIEGVKELRLTDFQELGDQIEASQNRKWMLKSYCVRKSWKQRLVRCLGSRLSSRQAVLVFEGQRTWTCTCAWLGDRIRSRFRVRCWRRALFWAEEAIL